MIHLEQIGSLENMVSLVGVLQTITGNEDM